jgi:hypothetical protein
MTFETRLYDVFQKGRIIIIERVIDYYNSQMAKNWPTIFKKFPTFSSKKSHYFLDKNPLFFHRKSFQNPKITT